MPFAIIQSNIRSHTPMLLTSDYPFGKAWLGFQFIIYPLYRQPHNIKVAALKTSDADVADPFLNAVGTSFVEWLVFVDVIVNLLVSKLAEGDVGANGEVFLLVLA